MKALFKILLSLFISIAVFFSFIMFYVTGLPKIEANYYQPSIVKSVKGSLIKIEKALEAWTYENEQIFKDFTNEAVVKRSVNQNQTDSDIKFRESLSSDLLLSVSGLKGIRIIESVNQRIHFSSFSSDLISKSDTLVSYAKYGKRTDEAPYELIECKQGSPLKVNVDTANNSFLFSLPFLDDYDVYRGTIVFYVSAKAFSRYLIAEKVLTISEDINLITDETFSFVGILTGLPYSNSVSLKNSIIKEWKSGNTRLCQISDNTENRKSFWILITHKTRNGYAGQLCEKNLLILPIFARYFLIIIATISSFLIAFLLLNIKQDKLFLAQNKIQKLHINIIGDLIKNSDTLSRKELKEKLEYRRHEANTEIKKVLGKRLIKKYDKEIDILLKENWNNILSVISGKYADSIEKNENAQILKILKQLVSETQNTGIQKTETAENGAEAELSAAVNEIANKNETEKPEALEEIDDIEEVEELSEDISAGDIEVLEESEPIESLEEVEELEELEETQKTDIFDAEALLDEAEELEELEPETEKIPNTNKEVFEAEALLDEVEELEPLEEDSGDFDKITAQSGNGKAEDFDPLAILDEAEEFSSSKSSDKAEKPKKKIGKLIEEVDDLLDFSMEEQKFKAQEKEAVGKFAEMQLTSGLDFSFLDEKNESLSSAELMYLSENHKVKNIKLKFEDCPIIGELEVIGEEEPYNLIEVEGEEDNDVEETIINKDGIFTIVPQDGLKPQNEEFKNLVDSILK